MAQKYFHPHGVAGLVTQKIRRVEPPQAIPPQIAMVFGVIAKKWCLVQPLKMVFGVTTQNGVWWIPPKNGGIHPTSFFQLAHQCLQGSLGIG